MTDAGTISITARTLDLAREDATLSDAVFGNSPMGAQLVKVK